jgi:hypothetical protein
MFSKCSPESSRRSSTTLSSRRERNGAERGPCLGANGYFATLSQITNLDVMGWAREKR